MKSYTDIEQSKTLAEILPLESADAHYVRESTDLMGNPVDGKWSETKLGNPEKANYIVQNFTTYEILPCWSLAALLEHLRKIDLFPEIINSGDCVLMDIYYDEHFLRAEGETILDACYEIIIKLHEQKEL